MGPGRRRSWRLRRRAGHAREVMRNPDVADRASISRASSRFRCRRAAASSAGAGSRSRARARTICAISRCSFPLGVVHLRHRRFGLGQVDAGARYALPGARAETQPQPRARRRAQEHRRRRASRQGHPRRSEPDRSHAALESRDLHRALHPHPRAVRATARGADARLRAGAVFVQRQGRTLRGVPGRRHHPHRDALPARRLRDLRSLRRQALQPRHAGDPVQGQEHRRSAQHDRARRDRVHGLGAADSPEARNPARRRPRLHPSRPVGDDALGRRSAAHQARQGTRAPRHRPHALHPRRADHRAFTSTTSRSCSRCSAGSPTPATRSS